MGVLHFKTNVLIKSILGKDLINDDNIAVLELVKNSFDAGSPTVDVVFKNLKHNDDETTKTYTGDSSKIVIKDFGKGMSLDDIENKWLNIAWSTKKIRRHENHRVLAGNKGVGRFSCDRLGQFLDIYTRSKDNKDFLHLQLNWKDFETDDRKDLTEKQKENLQIQQVPVKFFHIPEKNFESQTGHKSFKQGTILEISKLRSQWADLEVRRGKEIWNVDKLLKLRNYLEKLVNPNQAFQKSSFTINLFATEFKQDNKTLNGAINNKIFDKLEFTATSIDSIIDHSGKSIITSITDKGRVIFRLEEKNVQFKLLKEVRVFLYYLNTYSKIYFAKQAGIRSIDFGSVFLFINGFMVPPYGETGNDWLGLEIRKGQGHSRNLSTRELVGRIEISDENNTFKIISSREGVVNDAPFQQLTQEADAKANKKDGYFYYTFKRLEKYVVDGLKWDRVTGDDDLDENETLSKKRAAIIRDFENRIEDKSIQEAQELETYYESETDKRRRVFSIIQNIISVKKENIIDLYINEDLIVDLVKEEQDEARLRIQNLLDKAYTLEYLDIQSELGKIEKTYKSINLLFEEVKGLSTATMNKQTLAGVQNAEALQVDFDKNYNSVVDTIKQLAFEKKAAEEKAEEERSEREKREAELEAERQKNTYLLATRRVLSNDADGLIHTIKINNTEIRDGIDNLIDDITSNSYSQEHLLRRLGDIKVNAERSLKLAEIATRSDFKSDIEMRDVDIVKYFQQYIEVYKNTFGRSDLNIEFELNGASLVRRVSVLNLAIIIDNIISNAIKWKAENIRIIFENKVQGTLSVLISDDGDGVSNKMLKLGDKIFDLGVGDTPPGGVGGSGIGLYFTRDLLKKMDANIHFVGNKIVLKGAAFEIIFN